MAEAHASGCARCQALVGAMARSAPEIPRARRGGVRCVSAGWCRSPPARPWSCCGSIVPGYRTMSPVQERSEPAAAVARSAARRTTAAEPPRLAAPPADAPRAAARAPRPRSKRGVKRHRAPTRSLRHRLHRRRPRPWPITPPPARSSAGPATAGCVRAGGGAGSGRREARGPGRSSCGQSPSPRARPCGQ